MDPKALLCDLGQASLPLRASFHCWDRETWPKSIPKAQSPSSSSSPEALGSPEYPLGLSRTGIVTYHLSLLGQSLEGMRTHFAGETSVPPGPLSHLRDPSQQLLPLPSGGTDPKVEGRVASHQCRPVYRIASQVLICI